MNIGFIGTGIMGRPMAGHLQAAGHTLRLVANRSPLPDELLAGGAIACGSPAEVAASSDCVILMLPDTPDVERVLFGPEGAISELGAGKTVIDMSSIDPIATREFAAKVAATGADYVDAPVSGGEVGARDAALTIMVGAEEHVFARIKPLLSTMGKSITLVGPVGSGQITKVANQIIVALNIQACAEALVFAAKAGADPSRVREALLGGFAASRILEVHAKRMIDRTFAPGFRIELHQKDLGLALGSARSLGLALPSTALAQQMFSACVAAGEKDADHSAMVRAIERMASCELDADV